MSSQLNLSICFLDPVFHGRRDGSQPEWPPSPLRLFQSLVAASARRQQGEPLTQQAGSALQWLEEQSAPLVIAPVAAAGSSYRISVPNNAMDIPAAAWSRGNDSNIGDANPATHRSMKTIRPNRLLDGDTLHYLWMLPDPLNDEVRGHINTITDIARSIVSLGWGIDLVTARAALLTGEQADDLLGERWMPIRGTMQDGLRVPVKGTLDNLKYRHECFLNRLGPDGFIAPPPLSTYMIVEYRRAIDPPRRSIAAFSLLKPDASGFRAFDTVRHALTVAGMMRHAARSSASNVGWHESKINAFVLGHAEGKGAPHITVGPKRFFYLPLPSIESRGDRQTRVVGSIRRVILTAFSDECEAEIDWTRRQLSGQELIDKHTQRPVAILSLLPTNERMIRQYVQPAASWATVTPVVLPGYDDPAHYRRRLKNCSDAEEQKRLLGRLSDRIDGLLRKTIVQAGFSQVLADYAQVEWRKTGFWPGTDLADRYGVPDHLKRFSRYHVQIRWRDSQNNPVLVPGPICLGGGRFYGLGLFAAS